MEELLTKINELSEDMQSSTKRLDEKSIWLFLSTLGCWSVTIGWVQLFAMAVVLFFLIDHVVDGNFKKKSFKSRISEIEKANDELDVKESKKNEVAGALHRYCTKQLGFMQLLKTNYRYVSSAFFYSTSLVMFLDKI
jgi:hypothetical protein